MARVALPKSSIKQRRRKRLLLVAGIIFALLVLVFLLSLWLANTALFKITHVSVSGEDVIPENSIETVVQDNITGRFAGLYSKANIFLYPKHKIEADLRALYPTLMSADIHALDFHTITVAVTERAPAALWCDDSSCSLIDKDGLVYAHAPDYSGNVYETYVGALPGGALPQQFLTPTEFHSLSALVGALNKKIAPDAVSKVIVDENNDVHLHISSGYEILFALKDNGGSVFEHFTLILTADPFTTHPLSDFEYIDLRFGDKVYYKLKN